MRNKANDNFINCIKSLRDFAVTCTKLKIVKHGIFGLKESKEYTDRFYLRAGMVNPYLKK